MGTIAVNFVAAHQQWAYGVALGFLLSNPGTCALLAFNLFVKIPGVGPWIGRNPDKAKAWADGFDKKIDECVDKYAAAQAAAPATKP